MDAEAEHPQLRPILANLSREICQSLDSLRAGIGRILDEPDQPISDAERVQARTMLSLCEDLGLLTRERLGGPPTPDPS